MKEEKQEVKEEVIEEPKQEVPSIDPAVSKELEELRKFKQEVEAQRKAAAAKPKEVIVSDSFFSNKENIATRETKSNYEKMWEEATGNGAPFRKMD